MGTQTLSDDETEIQLIKNEDEREGSPSLCTAVVLLLDRQ